MPLHSMTGFARADGGRGGDAWTWEMRSVNGRGLDIRLRVPSGFERVEVQARKRISARLTRGNVQATLSLGLDADSGRLRLNLEALDALRDAFSEVEDRFGVVPGTAEGVLALRGVLVAEDRATDDDDREAREAAILIDLDRALDELESARAREGAALSALLATRLSELEAAVAEAEVSPARTPEAIRRRLEEQVAALVGTEAGLDPARLHQEAVLLATRADIREELDRLNGHVAAARALLSEGGAVGRRLDFLAQEFNREVNTLCAKSNDLSLTSLGLGMKSTVDQFREQVQNLE